MRRSFDQPTSSSVSRSANTEAREQTQQPSVRTRQPQHEASSVSRGVGELKRQQSISARRRSIQQPYLIPPDQSSEPRPPSPRHRSPTYLQGKNPYGQILDKVEHPYREPTIAGPPSQSDASVESRPRTSGSFQFKIRPPPDEPKRTITAPDPQPLPLPPRGTTNPLSVQAARSFFETKAFQNKSAPLLPPSGAAAIAAGATIKKQLQSQHPLTPPCLQFQDEGARPTCLPSPTNGRVRGRKDSDPTLSLPSVEVTMQAKPPQRVNTISRCKEKSSAPNGVVNRTTAFQESFIADYQQSESNTTSGDQEAIGRQSRTNDLELTPRNSKLLVHGEYAIDDRSKLRGDSTESLITVEKPRWSDRIRVSGEIVRHHSLNKSTSAAEPEEAAESDDLKSVQKSRCTKTGRNVRRAFNEDTESASRRFRCREPQSAPLTSDDTANTFSRGLSSKLSIADLHRNHNQETCLENSGETTDVHKRVEGITAKCFSHDGSSSRPSSRCNSLSNLASAANVGVENGYHNMQVPDHVDCRAAYGRRKTQDFGFPGARLKPHGNSRTYKPLQDPGNWLKRACGHFSYADKGETREDASKKICRQCSTKETLSEPEPGK